ncbi:MAG: O-antigen polymerase [bacterium]|nr:O-antigen polymerase [bacterium]
MMVDSSVLTIIPAFLLLMLALFARAMQGNWLAPGAFFSLCWTAFTFIPLIWAPEYIIYPAGLWAIVMIVFSFQAGALIRFPLMTPSENEVESNNIVSAWIRKRMFHFLFLLTVISGIGVALLVSIGIKMLGAPFSIEGLLRLGNLFSVLRYNEEFSSPLIVNVFLYWVYPATLFGGLYFSFTKTFREKLICILPIFISFLNGIVVAARAGILFSIVLWLSGFLSMKVYLSRGKYKALKFEHVSIASIGILSLSGIYMLLQWLRGGIEASANFSNIFVHMKVAIAGYLSAFTAWYNTYEFYKLSMGAYTFAGPFNFLGLAEREQGLYSIPVYIESGSFTNIFTIFRGLIQDFSLPGTLVIFFLAGLVNSLSYHECIKGNMLWILPLSIFYAITLFSPLTSIFTYNSVVAAWIVASAVWFLAAVEEGTC